MAKCLIEAYLVYEMLNVVGERGRDGRLKSDEVR